MALQEGGANYEWLAALGAGIATAFAWFAWFVKRMVGKASLDPMTKEFFDEIKSDYKDLDEKIDRLIEARGKDAERIARLEGRLSQGGRGKLEEEPAEFRHNSPGLHIVK